VAVGGPVTSPVLPHRSRSSTISTNCTHQRTCRICDGLKGFLRRNAIANDAEVRRYFGNTAVQSSNNITTDGSFNAIIHKPVFEQFKCSSCRKTYFCPQCVRLAQLIQVDPDTLTDDECKIPMQVNASSYSKGQGHAQISWEPLAERQLILVPVSITGKQNQSPVRVRNAERVDIGFMRTCLRRCEEEHVKCKNPWDNAFIEARVPILLMDLDDRCLVWSTTDANYVTLSYVWGVEDISFECRRSSITQLRVKGSLDDRDFFTAPRTIRDAMDFAKAMGERYLWVDRYCIIQDDHGQKASQILSMAIVYARSRFTIIAADGNAKDGLAGWPHVSQDEELDSPTSPTCRPREDNVWYPGRSTSVIAGLNFTTATLGKSWNTRGWTFQEKIFSRRAIIFHGGLAFWKCQRFFWQEDFKHAIRAEEGPLASEEKLVPLSWPDLRQLKQLLEKFAVRSLSYPCDSLNAFSGISSFLQEFFPDGFLFGLPEMWFDIALLWQPKEPLRDRIELSKQSNLAHPDLPSWSWARWQGQMNLEMWNAAAECLPRFPNEAFGVRIHPIVLWNKTSTASRGSLLVSNSFASMRKYSTRRDLIPPQGWSRRTILDHRGVSSTDHFFHNNVDDNTGFSYPIPLSSAVRRPKMADDSLWVPYISGRVTRAFFVIGDRIESNTGLDSCYWVRLLSRRNGVRAGVLCLNTADCTRKPEELKEFQDSDGGELNPKRKSMNGDSKLEIELIAISRAEHQWIAHDRSKINSLDAWEIQQAVKQQQGIHGIMEMYEYYNVMWIQKTGLGDGSVKRRALGRVHRSIWEQEFDELDVILR
jgi:hypothetical protein